MGSKAGGSGAGMRTGAALIAATLVLSAGAGAQQGAKAPRKRAAVLEALTACRAITDGPARLACFDREVARLETAERDRDVVVVDRAQVRETRRTLFGLTLPRISLFGDRDDDEKEEVREIESTIASTSAGAYGKLLFVLADGSRWRQVDQRNIVLPPKPGTKVKVRKGLTTNFRLVYGSVGVAVRREN